MNYAFTKACLDYFARECMDAQGLNGGTEKNLHRGIERGIGLSKELVQFQTSKGQKHWKK